MRRTYKHKLIPTKTQLRALEETLETHRRLYNQALALRKEAYEERQETLSWYDQKKWLTKERKGNPWFLKCNRNSLDATLKRLDLAYQAFFRRVKKGGAPGFPRFKGCDFFNSFEFVRDGNGFRSPIWEEGGKRVRFYAQGIGQLKVWMDRPLLGRVKTLELVRENGKWYACFSCDLGDAAVPEPRFEPATGIDLGLESFLTTSEGDHVANPRPYRKGLAHYKRLSRQLSRKKKGGSNRRKAKQRLKKQAVKIRNRRNHFLHCVSKRLVTDYGMIAAEKLNMQGMLKNKYLAMSISDASWGRFIELLKYKGEGAGCCVVLVDPRGTSQLCSRCGSVVKKGLRGRQHDCPSCGYSEHRDVNAAKNILTRGYMALTEPSGANAGARGRVSREPSR